MFSIASSIMSKCKIMSGILKVRQILRKGKTINKIIRLTNNVINYKIGRAQGEENIKLKDSNLWKNVLKLCNSL